MNCIIRFVPVLVLTALGGCATPTELHHRPASESWDQANLKRNDIGCPTAIFIAPGGNLVECDHKRQLTDPFLLGNVPQPEVFTKYNTKEDAAIASLKQIAQRNNSTYYEWGGVIGMLEEGKYIASVPTTDFSGDSVMIHRAGLGGIEIVAQYHTHPCIANHDVEFFSPEDLESVIYGHDAAAFMGDFCSGNVHEYIHGDDPAATDTDGIRLTRGRIIGQFTSPHTMIAQE